MREVVIASAARTAVGSFGGAFKSVSAVELGVTAAKEAIKRANITPDMIDESLLGGVLTAGLGQNIARQIALGAGIPVEKPAMTINIVCGSGLRSVSMASQLIALGDADIMLVGGAENMSMSPYLVPSARYGARMGDAAFVDSMIKDGLSDIFNNYHMGITAENIAEQWNITREEQDELALASQNKAEKAQAEGKFDEEIVPVVIKGRKGDTVVDKKDGTVTAGNASGINDGAAMLVVMAKEKAEELGIEPLATIVSYGTAGVDPKIMGYGPVPATKKALEAANMTIEDIDLVEANEAFAAQSVAVIRDLNIDMNKVNVNGGAIAIGHPIGCSGARILTTLLYEMKRRDAKTGLATLCIGGGMGTTLIVKR